MLNFDRLVLDDLLGFQQDAEDHLQQSVGLLALDELAQQLPQLHHVQALLRVLRSACCSATRAHIALERCLDQECGDWAFTILRC